MMREFALDLLAAVALAVFAAAAPAQVTQVPNTGCQGARYPTHSGSAQIGQPFSFGFTCSLASRRAFAIVGLPGNGGVSIAPPVACDPGPCVIYPSLVGGLYVMLDWQVASGSWTVNVPNQSGLVGMAWALQCACYCP